PELLLPPSELDGPARQLGDALPHADEDGPAGLRGFILVVDDNDVSRDILVRRLVRQGHTVAEARDGRQALEKAAAESFDLILLDILMPGLNGFQVLERLKADERLREV